MYSNPQSASSSVAQGYLLFVLHELGLNTLPENVLIGALLDISSHYNRTSDKIGAWAMAGDCFLRGTRTAANDSKPLKPSCQAPSNPG